jgi:hypothetical protein
MLRYRGVTVTGSFAQLQTKQFFNFTILFVIWQMQVQQK